jgi:hypothetical protein
VQAQWEARGSNATAPQAPTLTYLGQADLDFRAKTQRRIKLDQSGAFPHLTPTTSNKPKQSDTDKEVNNLKATIASLTAITEEVRPKALLDAQQKRLDFLLGKGTSPAADERDSARLHKLLATAKNHHATNVNSCRRGETWPRLLWTKRLPPSSSWSHK